MLFPNSTNDDPDSDAESYHSIDEECDENCIDCKHQRTEENVSAPTSAEHSNDLNATAAQEMPVTRLGSINNQPSNSEESIFSISNFDATGQLFANGNTLPQVIHGSNCYCDDCMCIEVSPRGCEDEESVEDDETDDKEDVVFIKFVEKAKSMKELMGRNRWDMDEQELHQLQEHPNLKRKYQLDRHMIRDHQIKQYLCQTDGCDLRFPSE